MMFSNRENVAMIDAEGSRPTFSFRRREWKYVIYDDAPIRDIIEIIHSFYPVAPYKPDIFPTFIQTTWCETPDWFVLREYLDRANFRYKLRIRRYGDHNGLTDTCFVEIKAKKDKVSRKYRFFCPYPFVPALFRGEDIREHIEGFNRDVPHFNTLYRSVRRLITEQGYRPILRAHHPRAYFQVTRRDPVRLTLDGFVTFTYLPDKRSFKEAFRLLETKLSTEATEELDELLGILGAQRVRRFSKFHRALKVFVPDLLEKINSML
jgi:hypothetical protein